MSERLAKRVLLLGWDAADLKIINPLLDAGEMPNLQRLVERGVMGNLSSLEPILSPILWTTIATGQNADRHGIHGFIEPRPDGSGVRPVTSTSVAAAPIWEILEQQGLSSAVVGWFATYPATQVPGIVVSDLFCNAKGKSFEEWPLGERIVSPPELEPVLAELRVHPSDITGQQVRSFIPDIESIDLETDKRPAQLVNYLARCATNHAAATHILEHERWDLLAVYFETIDRFCHCFMEYHPPRLERISEEDYTLYHNVVDEIYRFHDLMLGRYLELAGDDTTIILISDHGFYSGDLRPSSSPNMKDGNPVEWHRPLGTFLASGPGISRDELVHGCSILDIAPTILHLLGLPVSRDMEGRVLQHILEVPSMVKVIDRYDRLTLSPRPLEGEEDLWEAQEAIRQLAALGYIDTPSEDAAKAVEGATVAKLTNLAQVYRNKRLFAEAIETLQQLLSLRPELVSAKLWLATNHISAGQFDLARELVGEILAQAPSAPWPNLLEGQILLREARYDEALLHFRRAQQAGFNSTVLYHHVGAALLQQKEYTAAENAFKQALAINGENVRALAGLGIAQHYQRRHEEAMKNLLQSIALVYAQPMAHYHLGTVLLALGHTRQALEAFQNANRLRPELQAPLDAISRIKKRMGGTLRQAVEKHLELREGVNVAAAGDSGPGFYRTKAAGSLPPEEVITVVSGIPRSGTSLMMQMLDKAGMELLVDGARGADQHNPHGYFEYEPVKRTLADNGWVQAAPGKAVKVVHALLSGLSPGFHYRIIFMERSLEDIIASQQAMLLDRDDDGKLVNAEELQRIFESQLTRLKTWLGEQPNIEVLYLTFDDAVGQPEQIAREVLEFLHLKSDVKAMAAVIDQNLSRRVGF